MSTFNFFVSDRSSRNANLLIFVFWAQINFQHTQRGHNDFMMTLGYNYNIMYSNKLTSNVCTLCSQVESVVYKRGI